jgi:hypothetical protein
MISVIRKGQGKGEYIGRPSPLGNPFYLKCEADREMVIAQYREWLIPRLLADTPQRKEFQRLQAIHRQEHELNLICFYSPKACHGDVIKELLYLYP